MTIRPVIGRPGAKKLAFHNIIRSVVVFVPRPTLPIVFNTERRGEVKRWRVSGRFLSLFCRGGVGWGKVTRVEGVKKVLKKGGRASPPSRTENTIMTECTRESLHLLSMLSLVCGSIRPSYRCGREKLIQREHRAAILGQRAREEGRESRGRILERNWYRSLKSFPPCYSQSPLLTGFYSPLFP
jgi:hypothetical protein